MADKSVVLTKDIKEHSDKKKAEKRLRKQERQSKQIRKTTKKKKFADLTPAEKDDLLKALALRLDLIKPD